MTLCVKISFSGSYNLRNNTEKKDSKEQQPKELFQVVMF